MERHTPRGFTLVELLVVITIMVTLLAMLMPALDKAVYQAELAACGGKLKLVASGATHYAMDHKKRYPYRPPSTDQTPGNVESPRRAHMLAIPPERTGGIGAHDERSILKPYIPINGGLNCALTGKLDLENTHADSTVFGSYSLWFGWYFALNETRHKGMDRLGDRLEWTYNGASYRFSTLASDVLVLKNAVQSSAHPDAAGQRLNLKTLQDQYGDASTVEGANIPGVDIKYVVSDYSGGPVAQVRLEPQFAYTDNSVERMLNVRPASDERLVGVPDRRNGAKFMDENLRSLLPNR